MIPRSSAPGAPVNMMYLARAEGRPTPANEVKGLLLLTPAEVGRLCRETLTLEQFRAAGGQALRRTPLDEQLPLEPNLQLKLLARLLEIHPNLLTIT